MIRRSARTGRRTQRGQGLLLLMLVMLVAGASVLLEGIGTRATTRAVDNERTTRALAIAKEALIAYAVTHPESPGRLPYPDRGNESAGFDGISDCVTGPLSPAHQLGQFPWQGTIASQSGCGPSWPLTERLSDGSGGNLWYAVSDKLLRRSPGEAVSLNIGLLDEGSPGNWLTVVDNNGNVLNDRVAAVIIVSGEATGCQDRTTAIDSSAYPAQFLDQIEVGGTTISNADPQTSFVIAPDIDMDPSASCADVPQPTAFNDRLTYITAEELLRAVERRVLGEVAAALWAYRQVNGAYPWLSPFEDPMLDPASDTVFDGVPGTRIGHLASNDGTDVGTHVQDTGFTISWTRGNAEEIDEIPVVDSDLEAAKDFVTTEVGAEFDDLMTSGSETFPIPTAPVGNPTCTWRGSNAIVDCNAATDTGTYTVSSPRGPLQVQRQRSYDVAYTGVPDVPLPPPVLDGARVRNVSSGAVFTSFPDASAQSIIEVRHTVWLSGVFLFEVAKRLIIDDGDTATVNVDGIYLEPSAAGTLAGDLPAWFYVNQWDRYVLVEYAGNALPGESLATGTACTPGANCVNLDVIDDTGAIGVTLDGLHAVVIGAGAQIALGLGQDRHAGTGVLLDDFFEEKNKDAADATAERRPWRSTWNFNDQARAVLQPF